MKKYNVIAIVGESGSGKDCLLQSLSSLPLEFNTLISHTTRPKRDNEKEGEAYYFVDDEYFNNNKFVEISEFRDWKYGTAFDSLKSDKVNVGVINPAGVYSLEKNPFINLKVFCLDVPAEIRLIRQLTRLANPDTEEIVRRYYTDLEDFKTFRNKYEYRATFLDNIEPFDKEIARVEIGKQIRLMSK